MEKVYSQEEFDALPLIPENNRLFSTFHDAYGLGEYNPWVLDLESRIRAITAKNFEINTEELFVIKAEGFQRNRIDHVGFEAKHKFSEDFTVPSLEPLIDIAGLPILTRGNVSVISGKPKSGKSLIAIFNIIGGYIPTDVPLNHGFNINKSLKSGGILYIDTEQSYGTFAHRIFKCISSGSLEQMPRWLNAYNLRIFPPDVLIKLTQILFYESYLRSSGLNLVIIDGIGDYSSEGPNEEKQSIQLVRYFEQLALIYDCHIVLILHKNKSNDNTRGFLGSQLERKVEASLDVRKEEDGKIIVVPEMLRNAGFCPSLRYQFDESGVPYFLEMVYPPEFKKNLDLIKEIFSGREMISKKEMLDSIIKIKDVKERRARDILDEFIRTGKVQKESGKDEYRIPEPHPGKEELLF